MNTDNVIHIKEKLLSLRNTDNAIHIEATPELLEYRLSHSYGGKLMSYIKTDKAIHIMANSWYTGLQKVHSDQSKILC